MGATTACILPANPNLHIRGDVGKMFQAVAGPLMQNDAFAQGPRRFGDIVPIHPGATPYQRIFAACAFPYEQEDFPWGATAQILRNAVELVAREGHEAVTIPFFHDIPGAAVDMTEPIAVEAMRLALTNAPIDVVVMALNDRQMALLQEAFADLDVPEDLPDAPLEEEDEEEVPETPVAPPVDVPAPPPKQEAAPKKPTPPRASQSARTRSATKPKSAASKGASK